MNIVLVIAASLLALSTGTSTGNENPAIPRVNSHSIEGESRYIWLQDEDGLPHLVDLQESIKKAGIQEARYGTHNHYWLFTRRNSQNYQYLTHGNENTIRASNYQGSRPINVIVHGWRENGASEVNRLTVSALLAAQDCNVIVVDWRNLASDLLYPISSDGVPSIGQSLGSFLIWLFNYAGGNWNNVHLVGFGLGAHVVGVAGRTVGGRPARVTGLDPSGPLWTSNGNAINILSGQYVEGIHTNAGVLGISNTIGHADFYVNDGRRQPGCTSDICSHRRAYELFAASVRQNHLIGCECQTDARQLCSSSTLHMGNALLNKRGSGIFCLKTGSSWPF